MGMKMMKMMKVVMRKMRKKMRINFFCINLSRNMYLHFVIVIVNDNMSNINNISKTSNVLLVCSVLQKHENPMCHCSFLYESIRVVYTTQNCMSRLNFGPMVALYRITWLIHIVCFCTTSFPPFLVPGLKQVSILTSIFMTSFIASLCN